MSAKAGRGHLEKIQDAFDLEILGVDDEVLIVELGSGADLTSEVDRVIGSALLRFGFSADGRPVRLAKRDSNESWPMSERSAQMKSEVRATFSISDPNRRTKLGGPKPYRRKPRG